MDQPRISLTRIIALNWYGFRHVIDLSDDILISGAYGTGKSALLDLIQYVMLGKHWRANKAAAGVGRGRDLVSYCLADTNQTNRNGERHFLRPNGVTFAALEFTFPENRSGDGGTSSPRRETWGTRIEFSSPNATPRQLWFYLPGRLEYAEIAPEGNMRDEQDFKTWVHREFNRDCLFARQDEYLAEMATARHLYFDRDAFLRTLPKAIAFEPEENVERFIREFILEKSPLDVRDVRASLRAYEETRQRLARQENEASFLRKICREHDLFSGHRREAAELAHLDDALRLLRAEENCDKESAKLEHEEKSNEADRKELAAKARSLEEVHKQLEAVRYEIQNDPEAVKLHDADSQIRDLDTQVKNLKSAQRGLHRALAERSRDWSDWLQHSESLDLDEIKQACEVEDSLLSQLTSGPDENRLAAARTLAGKFEKIWRVAETAARPLEREHDEAERAVRRLRRDLDSLEKGSTPGDFPFFRALKKKLGGRAEQLGRLIEVRPEAEDWWPILEQVLGEDRWTVVVESEDDYSTAFALLQKTPPGREGESLLRPREVSPASKKKGADEENLWTKVEVTNELVSLQVEKLLSPFRCVENVKALEKTNAPIAVSRDGFLKRKPLRERLRPFAEVELTLGKKGLERMRQAKEKDWLAQSDLKEQKKQAIADLHAWLDRGKKMRLGSSELPGDSDGMGSLPDLENSLATARSTYDLLATPELKARQDKVRLLEEKQTTLTKEVAVLEDRCKQYLAKTAALRERIEKLREDIASLRYSATESRDRLSRDFPDCRDEDLNEKRDDLRSEFSSWSECLEQTGVRREKAHSHMTEARQRRDHERQRLAEEKNDEGKVVHPQYRREFDLGDEDNTPWSRRLEQLETVELQASREKAENQRGEWERRLQENVLNELNQRLYEADQTIKLLRKYLKHAPVGKNRYQISQRRDPSFAPLWRLLDTGLEPTDPLAAAAGEAGLEEAKRELMDAVDAADDEKAGRLLDYRNYHHYDIEIVPTDTPDVKPLSFGKSGRKMSGGENQAPFFISILAAFRRVYDLGRSDSPHLGLVVMDEAFSKLSGDGIEDCLALARNFRLQLVMAFPPERLGVMVPHAQTVVLCQKEIGYASEPEKGGSQKLINRIDNTPLVATMEEAMDLQ